MSSTSATTYTHTCDMCGKTVTTANYTGPFEHLYAKRAVAYGYGGSGGIDYAPCDICSDCAGRPIIDLIEWFRQKYQGLR